ncbi:hypothetical protein [Burkholderia cepacia]|uniref:hypothetical protein n=1 Tax=Burkholderia cepacia TaxID=292 RepID=UPI000A6EB687|nr:hypothetical protein [Burkholderia cepacia]
MDRINSRLWRTFGIAVVAGSAVGIGVSILNEGNINWQEQMIALVAYASMLSLLASFILVVVVEINRHRIAKSIDSHFREVMVLNKTQRQAYEHDRQHFIDVGGEE